MNRGYYFNYIEEKLSILAYRISLRGRLNILDLNIYSENFFADLINIIFNFNLVNMNVIKQNIEGLDLLDNSNKVFAQVSATASKQKVENSLSKNIFKKYPGYKFKFISIAKDATELKKQTFKNPHMALFNPNEDIIDIYVILNIVLNMSIENQEKLYDFIKKELGSKIDVEKVYTNLADIINILALENLANTVNPTKVNTFQIEKKIKFNNLKCVKSIIGDYKIFHRNVDEIYKVFDTQGMNKSFAVLQTISKQYTSLLLDTYKNEDEIFLKILENVMKIIKNSENYKEIPYEELDMCIGILVVDAFIRCKIFENPEGYDYVIT